MRSILFNQYVSLPAGLFCPGFWFAPLRIVPALMVLLGAVCSAPASRSWKPKLAELMPFASNQAIDQLENAIHSETVPQI